MSDRGRRGPWLSFPLALGLFALGACSAIVDADLDELGPPPEACEPGEQVTCACAGGSAGTQQCNADGGFDSCVCRSGGGAGVGPVGSGAGGNVSAGAGAGGTSRGPGDGTAGRGRGGER